MTRRGCRRTPLLLAGALAALTGCTSPARPGPCPGEAVATLRFQPKPIENPDGGSCAGWPDAGDAGVFTGTIAAGSSGQAYLCVDRAEATPLSGTLVGDHLAVVGSQVEITLDACACPLFDTQQLEGDVLRGADGGVIGFDGGLSDVLAPVDGGTTGCERDGGTGCGVTCVARWSITAAP
jgi:hypothetical protein